jgi:hypothetical protein
MTKKSTQTTHSSETPGSPDPLTTIYTAHQVHTLAHLIFQQWAGSRQSASAPSFMTSGSIPGRGWGWPQASMHGTTAGSAALPYTAPGWFHWHP